MCAKVKLLIAPDESGIADVSKVLARNESSTLFHWICNGFDTAIRHSEHEKVNIQTVAEVAFIRLSFGQAVA